MRRRICLGCQCAMTQPTPALEFIMRVRVEAEPIQSAGVGLWGERRLVPIVGGHF